MQSITLLRLCVTDLAPRQAPHPGTEAQSFKNFSYLPGDSGLFLFSLATIAPVLF